MRDRDIDGVETDNIREGERQEHRLDRDID